MRICITVVALALMLMYASPRAWSDEKSHRTAAEELLTAMNIDKVMTASIDQMLAIQIKANPSLEPVKDVMKKFLAKHLSYAAIKDDLIKLYTAEFTETELRELTAFYRTPTGKRSIEKMPALMQKGSELGIKRVQDNSAELQQLIQEELKKKPKP
jgi:uncharacterized protein